MLQNSKTKIQQAMENPKILERLIKKLLQATKTSNGTDFTKKCLCRYLFTFSFEIGCQLPTQQQLKTIYNSISNTKTGFIEVDEFIKFIKSSLELYLQSKKEPLGGIFERLIIKLTNNQQKANAQKYDTDY